MRREPEELLDAWADVGRRRAPVVGVDVDDDEELLDALADTGSGRERIEALGGSVMAAQ